MGVAVGRTALRPGHRGHRRRPGLGAAGEPGADRAGGRARAGRHHRGQRRGRRLRFAAGAGAARGRRRDARSASSASRRSSSSTAAAPSCWSEIGLTPQAIARYAVEAVAGHRSRAQRRRRRGRPAPLGSDRRPEHRPGLGRDGSVSRGRRAARRTGRARSGWTDLTFLHWRVDLGRVAPLLPAGTRPDLRDGATWVGLIPFRMRGAAFGSSPAAVAGQLAETNVRLYAVDARGRRGVVFGSLASNGWLRAGLAAGAGLHYTWSRMRIGAGPTCSPTPAADAGRVRRSGHPRRRPGRHRRRPDDPLADFLTARWAPAHPRLGRRPRYLPNTHAAGRCRRPSCSSWTTTARRRGARRPGRHRPRLGAVLARRPDAVRRLPLTLSRARLG